MIQLGPDTCFPRVRHRALTCIAPRKPRVRRGFCACLVLLLEEARDRRSRHRSSQLAPVVAADMGGSRSADRRLVFLSGCWSLTRSVVVCRSADLSSLARSLVAPRPSVGGHRTVGRSGVCRPQKFAPGLAFPCGSQHAALPQQESPAAAWRKRPARGVCACARARATNRRERWGDGAREGCGPDGSRIVRCGGSVVPRMTAVDSEKAGPHLAQDGLMWHQIVTYSASMACFSRS